jgi:hypothetical protein
VEYFDSGEIKAEGEYYMGIKTGQWVEWKEDLQTTITKNYDSIETIKKKILEWQKKKSKK